MLLGGDLLTRGLSWRIIAGSLGLVSLSSGALYLRTAASTTATRYARPERSCATRSPSCGPSVRLQRQGGNSHTAYVGGLPIEMFQIESVYNRPETQSLQIPWEARLKTYLEVSEKHKLTRPMQPFSIGMVAFSPAEAKAAGIPGIRPRIRIAPDGTVEIIRLDADLSDARQSALFKDVANWRIFPPVKEGKPIEKTVTCPINFRKRAKRVREPDDGQSA